MNKVIEMSASDASQLLEMLLWHKANHGLTGLRVCMDGDWVKFKANQSGWTHELGKLDPQCREAARQRVAERESS